MSVESPRYGMVVHNAVETWMLVSRRGMPGDDALVWYAVWLGVEAAPHRPPQLGVVFLAPGEWAEVAP